MRQQMKAWTVKTEKVTDGSKAPFV